MEPVEAKMQKIGDCFSIYFWKKVYEMVISKKMGPVGGHCVETGENDK